jgi:hypothetical protein
MSSRKLRRNKESRGCKGGAGAKLLVETLMLEKNTPDVLRPGPTDDPRIDSLDKDSIRKRAPAASA